MKTVGIIGSGFSSLAAAAILAKNGYDVSVFEKNGDFGGRARKFEANGYHFDMGPSWYWMPEVFEQFYAQFDKKVSDFYELKRLDPSYKVIFGKNDEINLPANTEELYALFESIETGSAQSLTKFLEDAAIKYQTAMEEFIWKPGQSILEFVDWKIFNSFFKLQMFSSISKEIRSRFKNERLIKILEFPVLFLGASPEKTPAMYSLMNYADLKLGTWYPLGGMHKIVDAFISIGQQHGVKYFKNAAVEKIVIQHKKAEGMVINGEKYKFDYIISGADYQHTEEQLISPKKRNYSQTYWNKRTFAPSCLIYYIGLNKKLEGFEHHNLFFDEDFEHHIDDIYTHHQWPRSPLFYLCIPSLSDESVAPKNGENLFVLIPISTELNGDDASLRERYFNLIVNRIRAMKAIDIEKNIVFQKSYCISEFKADYNAYKGNAYGLANTLKQTSLLKPSLRSKKINNLYFSGQLTVPGPGVPPAIISGQLVAKMIMDNN